MRTNLFVVLAAVLGCSNQEPVPTTFPVTGSVSFTNGKPYAGGTIQFRLDKNQELTVTGKIEENGTFSLYTIKGKQRIEGAPPGSYEVMIAPAIGKDRKMPFLPFFLPKNYQVQERENHFKIQADPPGK